MLHYWLRLLLTETSIIMQIEAWETFALIRSLCVDTVAVDAGTSFALVDILVKSIEINVNSIVSDENRLNFQVNAMIIHSIHRLIHQY